VVKLRITVCHVPDVQPAKSTQEAQRAIRVSDRRLAARLDMFGRLNRDEDMPGIEQSVIPAATGESPADGDFLNWTVA
jgi:hypothetical protein